MGVDETTSRTDGYNERNNPFPGPIDTVTVEPKRSSIVPGDEASPR
jgi:hypothetical protein